MGSLENAGYDHSIYTIDASKSFKNICFDIKSFQKEAILTEMKTPDFELTAENASGGGVYQIGITSDDGQFIQGTVENKELLVKEIFDYLINKNKEI